MQTCLRPDSLPKLCALLFTSVASRSPPTLGSPSLLLFTFSSYFSTAHHQHLLSFALHLHRLFAMKLLVDESSGDSTEVSRTTSPDTVSRLIAADDSWTESEVALQTIAQ